MPDDRLFHKRLGHSEKVNTLTDFEDRVWRAYILSADDFGVMRFSAVTLQADHDYLASRPQKALMRALTRVHGLGLITTFEHQGRTYCAQQDWQNHQRVKHPRQTINPKPPDDVLATFTPATRALFSYWPGKKKEIVADDSGNSSPTVSDLARAGACETAHANGKRLTADGSEGGATETPPVSARPTRGLGAGVMAGALPRDHLRHAACSERLCVPDFIHARLQRQRGGDLAEADAWLRAWYPRVLARWEGKAIGEPPEKFWPREFNAEFPAPVAPKPGEKAGGAAYKPYVRLSERAEAGS